MKTVLVFACAMVGASAFLAPAPTARRAVKAFGYIPSGMSKEQWAAMQKKEADAKSKKDFGAGGARGFKSRSMQSFMVALEKGEASHLFAVDPRDVAAGKIPLKDVPYMQRGGSWDNSDLTTTKKGWMKTGFGMTAFNDGNAEKKKENKYDAKYNPLKPSFSIFDGIPMDWTGKGDSSVGGVGARAKKNGISNDEQMWRDSGALSPAEVAKLKNNNGPKIGGEEKKKFFGLF
ncbi:hypothetical protein M885DRAFT_516554 [Pelagophyceae sp. CCMP2097]|nr:hypothetical protein M885DRAFT_516554 [Pelagophyceae sp. CCMP2097]